MKVGIYGFKGSGKTTVFNVLSGQHAETGFGSRQVNLASVKVPDERVDRLSAIYSPKKTTYAEVQFVDVPGRRTDTKQGGLDTEQLNHLRDADAFALVLRDFASPYHDTAPDPLAELIEIESELVLTDLMIAEKRLARIKKEHRLDSKEGVAVASVVEHLQTERPLREMSLDEATELIIRGFSFVSLKPAIILVNATDDGLKASNPGLEAELEARGLPHFRLPAALELEILDLDPSERAEFLDELGLQTSSLDAFLQQAYTTLDLISFFTTGEDECRAWPILRGTVAQKAAGKVHSDIERGFIRAEICDYQVYVDASGDEPALRKAGKMRLEGKEYVVRDGDVIHYRFSV